MRPAPTYVALVTHSPNPQVVAVDADTPLLGRALRRLGLRPAIVQWSDASVEWGSFDMVVLRSTWDYDSSYEEFRGWISRVAASTAVLNPPWLLRWGVVKDAYLAEMDSKGVPIVSTTSIAPAVEPDIPEFEDFVVKPSIGAGSRQAARYTRHDRREAVAHVHSLHERGLTAIVQPYDTRVDRHGERSMIFIDGRFSHAIRKGPVLRAGTRQHHRRIPHPRAVPHVPSAEELALGHRVLDIADSAGHALYARIDTFSDDGLGPTVAEIEVVEPNLFLNSFPPSFSALARAIADRLSRA